MAHDDEVRAKAMALTSRGMSPRDAADRLAREGIVVGWRSIYRWEADRVAAVNGAPKAPRKPAKGPAPPTPPQPSPSAPPPLDDPAALEAEAAEALDAADAAHGRLDLLHRRLAARVDAELEAELPDIKLLTGISKLMLEVALTLAKTRPPVQLSPEEDPTNLAAAARLVERLDKLVNGAKAKAA